jgi:hypothetical protein
VGAFKRVMGIDVVDFAIHVVTTGFVAGLADAASSHDGEGFVLLIMAASTVLLGVRRHLALRKRAPFPETTGEVAALRVEELESRVAELELGQTRMQELEERLDFAERLLARRTDAVMSPPRGEA